MTKNKENSPIMANLLKSIFTKQKRIFLVIIKGYWIIKIEKSMKEYMQKSIPGTVKISIKIFVLFMIIIGLITLTTKAYKGDFGRGILIESFGMLFDIFIIAIIILWLNEIRDKRLKRKLAIERYQEEIDDFRGWESKEAMYRIAGNIKRLNNMGISKIDLSYCYLVEAKLGKDPQSLVNYVEAKQTISDLTKRKKGYLVITEEAKGREWIANLQSANLMKANLENANLISANLCKANLYQADLQGAYLYYTNLQEANLRKANLQYTMLGTANLQGTILIEANLQGARYLTVEQLSKAETLHKAKLDPKLMKILKEKHPHLLEMPKDRDD